MSTTMDKVKAHISLLKQEINQLNEDVDRLLTDHGRGTLYAEIEIAERILEREEEYLKYMERADELRQFVELNYEHSTDIQDVAVVDWLIEQAEKLRELKKFNQ